MLRPLLWALIMFGTAAAQHPLSVLSVTPTGHLSAVSQGAMVTVTFSEPVVPLSSVGQDTERPVFSIAPAVKGKFRWMGTSTAAFIADAPLPHATAFTVTVPAGIRTAKGATLPAPLVWNFVTPLPAVTGIVPQHGSAMADPKGTVTVRFNQLVSPLAVSSFISLHEKRADGQSTYPAFTTLNTGIRETTVVILRPLKPFGPRSSVTVVVKKGAAGVQGTLGMPEPFIGLFTTAPGFAFMGIGDTLRNPEEPLTLSFATPVYAKELYDHLSFTDPETAPDREHWMNAPRTDIPVRMSLKPGRSYTGILRPGLSDRFGQTLRDTVRFRFTTRDMAPVLHMGTGVGVVEAYAKRHHALAVLNVDRFRVQMASLTPERVIPVLRSLETGASYGGEWYGESGKADIRPFAAAGRPFYERVFTPKLTRNASKRYPVVLDTVLGASKTGIVLVQADYSDQYRRALLQVTNLGLTAKFSPSQSLVWVTRLKDGAAVEGAAVELRNDSNRVLWSGKTDKSGIVKAPGYAALGQMRSPVRPADEEGEEYYGGERPRLWAVVRNGNDAAFTNSDLGSGIAPWSFGIAYEWYPRYRKCEGAVYTDRGLYKAGERVEFKAVVRRLENDDWSVPNGEEMKLTVRDARNEVLLDSVMRLSPFGSAHLSLDLPGNAPLGYYGTLLSVRSGKGWTTVHYGSFRVESFRPAEFDVTASTDTSHYVVGDSVSGLLSSRYLFGAPVRHGAVRWRFSVFGARYEPPGYDGYRFEPLWWLTRYTGTEYRELSARSDTLDDQGTLRVGARIGPGSVRGTSRLMLEGDVTSPSRQVVSGRTSVLLHGGEYYVGIGVSTSFVPADSAVTMKVVAVTPAGVPVTGRSVAMKTWRRIWRSVQSAESGGRYSWRSETEDIAVDSATVEPGTKPAVRRFVPVEPGFYYTEVSSTDDRGNRVLANGYFYVSGSGYVPWERSDDDRIELITDREKYRPGDVARIIVKNPYEQATALVTVEREGIMQHFTTVVNGSAPELRIPVRKEFLPNVFISVVLLQGRSDSVAATRESDLGRPSFKMGYAALSVSPEEKRLSVTVATDRSDYRPGDSVRVTVRTRGRDGRGTPAEVTLSAADQGVLNLIAYRLPNLFGTFYAERGLSVTTSETRAHLIEQRNFGEKAEVVGGGGAAKMMAAMDAEGIRKEFRASAFWRPSVITDQQGNAVLRFKLPDNITGFQLMASAHTVSGTFGYAETTFTVSKPLLLQPAFPRFVRSGDLFEGGAVVMNGGDRPKSVRIVMSARGSVTAAAETSVVEVPAGGSKEVRRRFTAGGTGQATFIVKAVTEEEKDGLQWSIPVTEPRRYETIATSGTFTEADAGETVRRPSAVHEELGSLNVTLSSTAMTGLSEGVRYLFEYPYGCLEQRMSRALPIILAADMVTAFSLDVLKGKDHRAVVQEVLDDVPSYQHWSGGFTYWKGGFEGGPAPYLSAYTMYGLTLARKAGYRVDRRTAENGMRYLREQLNERAQNVSEGVDDAVKALTVYVLALEGSPDPGQMERLFVRRASLPLEAKAFLLRALVRSGSDPSMVRALVAELRNMMKHAPTSAHFEETAGGDWWRCWYSPVRSTAIAAAALLEAAPQDPALPKVVRWLVDRQRGGRWRTTQENMFVASALSSYYAVFEKETPDFSAMVRLAGRTIMEELFRGRSLSQRNGSVPLSALPEGDSELSLDRKGTGRLYYTLRMRYYPKGPARMMDEGFTVTKTVEQLRRVNDSVQSIEAGTLAKVTVTVATPQHRSFVVIDDPLPAGWEIVNTTFETTGRGPGNDEERTWWFDHQEYRDDRALFFANELPAGVHRATYLVRATSFGTYAMPSTYVEQMYEPEVFGQTASSTVIVK